MDNGQTIRVVIADDESSIRNGLNSAVPWDELGMSVIGTAKDGQEAWELIEAYRPAVAVTDIKMPRMTGLELIKQCRDHKLPTKFIILSGYDDFSYAQTAIRYGAKAYVLKPLKIDELMAELEDLKDEILKERSKDASVDLTNYHSLQTSSKKLFLNQLIHSEYRHSSDIRQKLTELHLPLTDSPYQVLVFSILQPDGEAGSKTMALLREGIEAETAACRSCTWESGPSEIVTILHTDGLNGPDRVRALALSCLQRIRRITGCRADVGIGPAEDELLNASRSYSKALTYLSYQLYEKDWDIYDESVVCTQPPAMSTSSVNTSELLNAIRRNDSGKIRSYCQDYFQSLLYVPMPPPSFIRGMTIYLVTDVQNALRKQVPEGNALFGEMPYVIVNRLHTLTQIMEWTTDLFLGYALSAGQYFQDRKDGIILEAKQFIKERMDTKIQAEDVASYVNLSASYFTIYFKQKTGVNFRDYVLNVKMEHAKYLLETGQANISEVSYAVGYDDYRSFYRAFKNHTGMTPSEYQAKH